MTHPITVEICIDSVEGGIAAEQGGAQRVELCDNLVEGGTTPSYGTIELALERINIDVNVMIRPRGGDFCYSDVEFEIMKRDVITAKKLGANGIVLGLLNPDGSIDVERTRELVDLANPLSVTFHRAFDMTNDPYAALEDLIGLGVDRVLTAGLDESVMEGIDLIAELVEKAGDRIIIMPGGNITERNIKKILEQTRAREVHFAAMVTVDSQMTHRNPVPYMGSAFRASEFALSRTGADLVRGRINAAQG